MSNKNKALDKRKGADILKGEVRDLLVDNEIASYVQKIKWELQYLKKILRQWSYSKNGNYLVGTNSELIKNYVSAINEYYEEDQFNQYFSLLQNFEVNLFMIESQKIIFKSFKLFPKAHWPIRFHNKFVSKLRSYSNADEVLYIMAQVYRAASGTMCPGTQPGGVRPLLTKSIPFNRFLTLKLMRQRNLFIHIGVEKVPIIKNGVIRRYEFTQYMHFLDILGDMYVENKAKLDERMNYFTGEIFNDAAKKDHSDEIEIDRETFAKNQYKKFYFFKQYLNEYTGRYQYYDTPFPDKDVHQFLPIPFKPYYVSNAEQNTVIYDEGLKRWLSKDHLTILERKKILEYQKQISDVMVKRFVDFQSAKTLVDLLTKIPNFKINLTDQQKDVIGENGNVLAIGRSGTGKTTCAVLRLFSIEMLFKIRMSLYKKKYEDTIKGVRCGSDDLDAAAGLHCIFLTASPVLTHEIQRYYKKLTDNIKTELDKKKKRVEEDEKKRQEEDRARQEREKLEAGEESFENLNEAEEEITEPQAKQQDKAQNLQAPASLQQKKSAEQLEEQREIHQQFQGLELKQDVNNEDFKEEEEDIDELKNKFEQSINKFHSLFDLKETDYPGFFTVRSFILMIDGALARPFFIRSKNTIVGEDSKASWHNERKGVMMIENYYRGQQEEKDVDEDKMEQEFNYSDEEELEHEYLRQIQLRENKEKQQLTKKLQKNKKSGIFSFQVDYEYFVVHFWPRVVKKYYSSRNITAHLVWTEIYSTIKGSAEAHQYPGQYLTQHAYINITTNTFLTREEKLDIYETFCQYERWKIRAGGYDIMDAVNYILNIIRFRGYEGPEIHYVMIDEVQDLPHAIVYLLSKTATYGVFYSGDTAQTIAKGVGFRFCDLNALFANLQLKKPIIKHLSVNFRSHNNILQLANSVVSSLEILFPKTIDRLKKEVSDLKGPKPMILASSDQQLLFYVLCGGEEQKVQGESSLKKPPLEFGCDQVIIVRDQQSKAKVPAMLQHALCLTIYEAKGLEFNDVILFNFFEESPCPEKWHLLKSLNVTAIEVEKEQYERNLSRHAEKKLRPKAEQGKPGNEEEQQDEEVQVEEFFNKEKNVYEVKKITSKDIKKFKDINDYAELCSQLKLLYTAITRPKKTLIIYDEGDAAARAPIERLWERLNVIQIITKELVLDSVSKKSMSEEVKIFETIVTSTDKSQWRQQGLKMYARGYFDQAMKCFDKSGSIDLYMKAEANKYAEEATKTLIEMESERNMIKQGGYAVKEMTSQELHKLKAKIKLQEQASLKKFQKAGRIFDGLLMFKQAGQCFFSGKQFQKAFESFCKALMHKQAAESLQMQNKYREAAEYYERDQNYLKVIECLDMGNEWFLILEKIQKFAAIMTEYEKQALLKKYSALALEELVYEIEFENEEESSRPENNRVEVIVEKESDEEDQWDSEEDPELAAEREYERKMSEESNPSRKQSEVSEEQKGLTSIKESVYEQLGTKQLAKEESKAEENSMSFSALNASEPAAQQKKEQLQQGVKSIDESFGDLNKSDAPQVLQGVRSQEKADLESIQSSFSDLNSKYQNQLLPDLQSIKSMVDPDDVWVKNSISEITHKLHSEYSVIDQQENYNINVKIIKTKGNIYVQDQIMRKIVNIVSIINSSVQEFFKQFKGYQSLITVSSGDKAVDILDNRPEISQFQDIDPKFINIILDTLQSFKLFKLCLFVCNRYHLPGKAGRYLISLGMKYSTNCISNNIVNPILLAPSSYRKVELQKGILASIAIHAIYENVNAEFLKIKVTDNEEDNKNTLGSYFIEGLILQGLYKKAVFMVNPQESLKILANYNDFDAYNTIFRQKLLKDSNLGQLAFFQKLKSPAEVSYTTMLLKKAIFEYCVVKRFQSVSQRYYKQFENQTAIDVQKRLGQFAIPDYLPFTRILFNHQPQALILKLKEIIGTGYKILTTGSQLQNLDFVCTLLAVIHNEQLQRLLVQSFDNDSFLQFYRCANYIKTVLRKLSGRNALVILESVLSMHQCYKINYCKSMTFVNDTFCFVNRTSTIANQLVENQKINSNNFAYFFQQDYNFILTKTSRVAKIISKKYEEVLRKAYLKRIEHSMHQPAFLHEDWQALEEESIIKKALSYDVQILGDPKKKKKEEAASRKKSKELKSGYDFRSRGREHVVTLQQSSSSEEEEYVDKQLKFYRYSTNKRMGYLSSSMLHWFDLQSSHAKEIVEGRYLYGCGINSAYREYTEKEGGFNLFDAMEFQRFKRVDLFAENILSVFDKLTLYTRQNLLGEILVLLLLQFKSLHQPEGFSVSLTSDLLKYLQGLRFTETLSKQKEKVEELSAEEVNHLLANNVECRFSYSNNYVCEMGSDDLAGMICDYLQLLLEEGASHYVDYSRIVLCYAINIGKNSEINECLRKVIKELGPRWKNQSLHYLIDNKSLGDYENKRKSLLNSPVKQIHEVLHEVVVENNGNLERAIAESEFDYQVEGRILKARARAVSKIARWWKGKRVELKSRGAAANYFQLAATADNLQQAKKPTLLGDIRLIRMIHKLKALGDLDLLIKTEQAKTQLLSFYLTTTISSSLDFHFILMNLNKIEQCRRHYFQYQSEDIDELHEYQIDEIHEEMGEMLSTIEVWKKDEKWLRDKNVNFKKKKVFEVKWMTKNIGLGSLLKKRAGLKKQAILQDKRRILKRIK